MRAGDLDTRITIEQRVETRDPIYNTPIYSWVTFATVWADVQDVLPSRAEKIAEGISIARRPARIRLRHLGGIDTTLRIKIGSRTLGIIAGPAELGRHVGIELIAEELSTQGQEP
ncbi:MAG: head-tail adaptor protein [Novosphingobium sp.]|nr:head-tail adaptor protein [Novosphingobium sp.]